MKHGKKWIALLLCAALCCSCGGCGSFLELYERLLIHGIGVDVGEDGYVVTVRSSSASGDEGEEYFKSQGKSVLEALNNLSLSTGREPFYSHNYLVVFGKKCAQEGLDQTLDFFVRYYNTRPAVKMFLAQDTAEEVLGAERDGALLKMSELQQLAGSGQYNGKTVGVDILSFINGVKREGSSPCLPVLKATDSGVEITATAIFDGYRLKDFLTLKETMGLLAVQDRIKQGEIVASNPEFGTATLSISTKPGKIQVGIGSGNRPVFRIKIQAEADISALSNGRNRLEGSSYGALEQHVAQILQKEAESAIEKAVIENQCDIFGFGNLLYQKYPRYWREASSSWKERMALCEYEVYTEAKVLRVEEEAFGSVSP